MKINIPIYRALKLGTKNEHVYGFLHTLDGKYNLQLNETTRYAVSYKIDPSTLAIHFPDMIAGDSYRLLQSGEKDLRIFASLSEDGKGGDVFTHCDYRTNQYTVIYNAKTFEFGIQLSKTDEKGCWEYSQLEDEDVELFTIVGIQQ